MVKGVKQFLVGVVEPVSFDCALERRPLEIYFPSLAAETMHDCFCLPLVFHGLTIANSTPDHHRRFQGGWRGLPWQCQPVPRCLRIRASRCSLSWSAGSRTFVADSKARARVARCSRARAATLDPVSALVISNRRAMRRAACPSDDSTRSATTNSAIVATVIGPSTGAGNVNRVARDSPAGDRRARF